MVLYKPKFLHALFPSTNSIEENQKNLQKTPQQSKIIVSIVPALAVIAITPFLV